MIDLPEGISLTSYQELLPDVRVDNHGTIHLVCPLSGRAANWIDVHVSNKSQWFGCSLIVEHGYAQDLIESMREAGLLVKVPPFTIFAGDQDRLESIRCVLIAVLERQLVVKVRQRNVPSTNGTLTLLQSIVRMSLAFGRDCELKIHLPTSAASHAWRVNGTAQGSDFGELGD